MIPEQMKAVVAHGIGDYRVETVPVPDLGDRDLLVEVEACGVCAGDIKCYEGGFRFWGGEGNPPYCEPPFIPGHEIVGRVARLGPRYAGPCRVGDRITVEQIVPCGECYYCKRGLYWLCGPHNVFGFKQSLCGGFAQYVRIPPNAHCFAVPEDMPLEQAALIEPYACGLHAVDRARIGEGDVVVIAGAGTLGLSMITAASALKPAALVSIEPAAHLRALALAMGATHAMDAWPHESLPPLLDALTEGVGCDVYIEASGHTAAISQGLNLLRKGGRFVEFSVFAGPASVDWSILGDAKELDLYGVSLSPHCFPKVIEGMRDGVLRTQGVVTHQLPLERFEEAFRLAKRRESIKALLIPPKA
ncbi:MAG TPA: alcohol dehydrogenase catalytic domain-containing protein [Clostridia bacterium]|nr:alcohol dehydrogenase catalytic domain-containing protein [Clostridia bacterium]